MYYGSNCSLVPAFSSGSWGSFLNVGSKRAAAAGHIHGRCKCSNGDWSSLKSQSCWFCFFSRTGGVFL